MCTPLGAEPAQRACGCALPRTLLSGADHAQLSCCQSCPLQLSELHARMQQLQEELRMGSQGLQAARSVPSKFHLQDFTVRGTHARAGAWLAQMPVALALTRPQGALVCVCMCVCVCACV